MRPTIGLEAEQLDSCDSVHQLMLKRATLARMNSYIESTSDYINLENRALLCCLLYDVYFVTCYCLFKINFMHEIPLV